MNGTDAEYAYVEQLAGEELQRWLMDTVKVSDAQAKLVVEGGVTGGMLLAALDPKGLLEEAAAGLMPASRYMIVEKVKNLKGGLPSCCLLYFLAFHLCPSFP